MTSAQAVLRLLSHDLRVATDEQLSVVIPGAGTAIRRLVRQKLIATTRLPVAIPPLDEPVYCWAPGQPAPDFDAIAWATSRRLTACDVKRRLVVTATRRARRLVGGVSVGWRQPLQIEHDLGVSGIYVARLVSHPESMTAWCGEDAFRRLRRPARGEKTPDGALLSADGKLQLVVDYLTRYPPERLLSFHRYWSARKVPYEWW